MMFGLNTVNDYIDEIVSLAREVEIGDPIDWGLLNIDEESAYKLMTMSVVEKFSEFSPNERSIMIATIVKLVVENFTLNLKLTGKENGDKTF
jgi:hypothetical protein